MSETQDGVRENLATATGRPVTAAIAARDLETLTSVFADDYVETVPGPVPATIHRADVLAGLGGLLELNTVALTIEPIATLGEHLQLHRTRVTGLGGNGDSGSMEYISVIEVDPEGRLIRTEAFATDELDGARARLQERYDAS